MGFQLWVNLPAAQKMGQPRYQEVNAASIPVAEKDGVKVRVVAGNYDGMQGPVTEIAAQPLYMDVTLEPGAEFCLPVPAGTPPSPTSSKAKASLAWTMKGRRDRSSRAHGRLRRRRPAECPQRFGHAASC